MKIRISAIGIVLAALLAGVSGLALSHPRTDPGTSGTAPGIFVTNPYINSVTVYPIDASGDAAPIYTIVGPDTGFDSRPGHFSRENLNQLKHFSSPLRFRLGVAGQMRADFSGPCTRPAVIP